jgi:hypothetical protein
LAGTQDRVADPHGVERGETGRAHPALPQLHAIGSPHTTVIR